MGFSADCGEACFYLQRGDRGERNYLCGMALSASGVVGLCGESDGMERENGVLRAGLHDD